MSCVRSAISDQHAFTASPGLAPGPDFSGSSETAVVEGRIVGLDVDGHFEVFAYSRGAWWGPCVTLDIGAMPTTAYANCHVTAAPRAEPPAEPNARIEFEVPPGDLNRVPWVR